MDTDLSALKMHTAKNIDLHVKYHVWPI